MSDSFGLLPGAGDPGAPRPPSFIALLSLKLGAFFEAALGTTGADLGNPDGGIGRLIPPGSLIFVGTPPARAPPGLAPMLITIGDPRPPELDEPTGDAMVGRPAIPIRCCCKALAFCMISRGRLLALGCGRLAMFRMPVTLELGLIVLLCCGSDTVRNDGTLRGMSSALELGGSSGVLASEDPSTDPGETGLLSMNSSGVSGVSGEGYRR